MKILKNIICSTFLIATLLSFTSCNKNSSIKNNDCIGCKENNPICYEDGSIKLGKFKKVQYSKDLGINFLIYNETIDSLYLLIKDVYFDVANENEEMEIINFRWYVFYYDDFSLTVYEMYNFYSFTFTYNGVIYKGRNTINIDYFFLLVLYYYDERF